MNKVLTKDFRCDNCDFASIVLGGKLRKTVFRDFIGLRVCVRCIEYECYLKDTIPPDTYNPYDLLWWRSRLVKKEMFYCCKCKLNIHEKFKLSSNPTSAVIVYCFQMYPLQTLCKACLTYAATVGLPWIAPEFCCLPRQCLTITIKTDTVTFVKGRHI